MEAVEADRKGKQPNIQQFKDFASPPNTNFIDVYDYCIKGSVAEELADAAIRLLDLARYREIDVSIPDSWINDMQIACEDEIFTESIYDISIIPCKHQLLYSHTIVTIIKFMLIGIFGLAKHLDIDLLWYIEQKIKYNQFREKMHGKKY